MRPVINGDGLCVSYLKEILCKCKNREKKLFLIITIQLYSKKMPASAHQQRWPETNSMILH